MQSKSLCNQKAYEENASAYASANKDLVKEELETFAAALSPHSKVLDAGLDIDEVVVGDVFVSIWAHKP